MVNAHGVDCLRVLHALAMHTHLPTLSCKSGVCLAAGYSQRAGVEQAVTCAGRDAEEEPHQEIIL